MRRLILVALLTVTCTHGRCQDLFGQEAAPPPEPVGSSTPRASATTEAFEDLSASMTRTLGLDTMVAITTPMAVEGLREALAATPQGAALLRDLDAFHTRAGTDRHLTRLAEPVMRDVLQRRACPAPGTCPPPGESLSHSVP